ncbi:substrate-binding periplasmic protein [Vogesella indigofera]|uniref:substrate-binding periplasmic protein n=1 Tax=Vogesella indigofera TaxID=45465 RepID=UPI00234FA117|nr:transporter substrate-binding domain-containing protein [Vogesella indigofera]MDC7707054.1 transporter substrate-binding domain-containing protein [Vogesella indigofera]
MRLILMLLLAAANLAGADSLLLATEHFPPYQIERDQRVSGFVADKVIAMLRQANLPYRLRAYPWQRAYNTVLATPQSCLFSVTRTPEREASFQWIGPLTHSEWTLYALRGRFISFRSLDEVRHLRIGTYYGDVRDSYLRQHQMKVDAAPQDRDNIDKLLQHRIDLWASDRFTANGLLLQRQLDTRIEPVLAFNRVELYLACNRKLDGGVVRQLQQALRMLKRDGNWRGIEQRYARWPDMPQHLP